ncbi:hypothetical protein BKA83DRAFT_4129107 [Pisolithus microcarpus]|nr:hypothetical protein BKA83DRAFT_4129107 [Pisolithus microcarpus]
MDITEIISGSEDESSTPPSPFPHSHPKFKFGPPNSKSEEGKQSWKCSQYSQDVSQDSSSQMAPPPSKWAKTAPCSTSSSQCCGSGVNKKYIKNNLHQQNRPPLSRSVQTTDPQTGTGCSDRSAVRGLDKRERTQAQGGSDSGMIECFDSRGSQQNPSKIEQSQWMFSGNFKIFLNISSQTTWVFIRKKLISMPFQYLGGTHQLHQLQPGLGRIAITLLKVSGVSVVLLPQCLDIPHGHLPPDPNATIYHHPPAQLAPGITQDYHKSLLVRVTHDASGQPIDPSTTPPQVSDKSTDDWGPYGNRLWFETAEFLFQNAELLAGEVDQLSKLWGCSLQTDNGGIIPPFADHKELYQTIDAT